MAEAESETASFVLAYLLKNQYSQTATAFLQECQVLPSKSLLILPETPLQGIISEYKSRSDTTVLLNTMGHTPTWKALWNKLESTLQQLRVVFEEGPTLKTAKHGTLNSSKQSQRSRATQLRRTQPQPGSQSSQPPPVTQASHILPSSQTSPVTQASSASLPAKFSHPGAASPHRRKPVPRRKELPASPSKMAPLSPGTQHVLDSLIEDNELPGKLADIINKCVTREDASVDLSPVTLDSIINQTYSDATLEGLISHKTAGGDHVTTTDNNPTQSPPVKKARVESSLTEQDIDDFLDQLHS